MAIEPWIFDEGLTSDVEVFEVEGHPALEVPRYGSLSIDEAQYLEWAREKYGLSNTSIAAVGDMVWALLALRYGRAAWSNGKLISATDKPLPARRQLLPPEVAQAVFMFFIDEFNCLMGKPRTALAAIRESQKLGQTLTNDSSDSIQTDDSGELSSDAALSTSSEKHSKSTRKNSSESEQKAIAA
jgi:hypothetical protein